MFVLLKFWPLIVKLDNHKYFIKFNVVVHHKFYRYLKPRLSLLNNRLLNMYYEK